MIGNVNVIAPSPDCSWTATAESPWIVLPSASGVGSGTLQFIVAPNPANIRFSRINIGTAYFSVLQDPGPCAFAKLTPEFQYGLATAGTGTFRLDVKPNCPWATQQSNSPWFTVTPSGGIGPATLTFTYTANTGPRRTAGVAIADGFFGFTQNGAECNLQLGATPPMVSQTGGRVYVPVTDAPNCLWRPSSSAAFVTPDPNIRVGTAVLGLTVEPNFTSTVRTSTITVNDKQFTLTQNAAGCDYLITPTGTVEPASGNVGPLRISATGPNCAWAARADATWVQPFPVTGDAGTTSGTYRVLPNFTPSLRTTTLHVATGTASFVQVGNSGTPDQRFVQLLYFGFLGRLPTAAELAYQTQPLAAGTPRGTLAATFFNAPEFQMGARFTGGLYLGILFRDAEFAGWQFQRLALASGAASQLDLVRNFVNSAEFQQRNGTLDNDNYVRLLYRQVLFREPSPAEVTFQAAALSRTSDRPALAAAFLNSEEFRISTTSRLTAFLLYACLLGREPSSEELVWRMQQITDGTAPSKLIADFVNSAEFNNQLQ